MESGPVMVFFFFAIIGRVSDNFVIRMMKRVV